MDLSRTTLFSMITSDLAYTSKRQDVLSQNIANLDTPDFTPKDVTRPNFEAAIKNPKGRLSLYITSPMHLGGANLAAQEYKTGNMKDPFEIKPVENAVSAEDQMLRVSQNAMEHQMATSMYKKTVDMFRTAVTNK